jgi:hypothetical protein
LGIFCYSFRFQPVDKVGVIALRITFGKKEQFMVGKRGEYIAIDANAKINIFDMERNLWKFFLMARDARIRNLLAFENGQTNKCGNNRLDEQGRIEFVCVCRKWGQLSTQHA